MKKILNNIKEEIPEILKFAIFLFVLYLFCEHLSYQNKEKDKITKIEESTIIICGEYIELNDFNYNGTFDTKGLQNTIRDLCEEN